MTVKKFTFHEPPKFNSKKEEFIETQKMINKLIDSMELIRLNYFRQILNISNEHKLLIENFLTNCNASLLFKNHQTTFKYLNLLSKQNIRINDAFHKELFKLSEPITFTNNLESSELKHNTLKLAFDSKVDWSTIIAFVSLLFSIYELSKQEDPPLQQNQEIKVEINVNININDTTEAFDRFLQKYLNDHSCHE